MPTIQAIPSQNDREFTISTGNWAGDMEWIPFYLPLASPAAGFTFQAGETEKQMTLLYPNVKIPPKKLVYAGITVARDSATTYLKATLIMSDGVNSFSNEITLAGPDIIGGVDLQEETPPDWNRNNSSLQLLLEQSEEEDVYVAAADNAVTQYDVVIDYLPLCGIG